jgi:hypothetical protein
MQHYRYATKYNYKLNVGNLSDVLVIPILNQNIL